MHAHKTATMPHPRASDCLIEANMPSRSIPDIIADLWPIEAQIAPSLSYFDAVGGGYRIPPSQSFVNYLDRLHRGEVPTIRTL